MTSRPSCDRRSSWPRPSSADCEAGGKGAGLYGGAGVAGFLALLFVSIALWWALGYLMGNAWSALIVAVLWGIVATVLFFTGKKEIEEVAGIPQTGGDGQGDPRDAEEE